MDTTIEELMEKAPESIQKSTLGNVKQVFSLAIHRAETCSITNMVDNLLFLGQGIDDLIDELAHAFHKGRIESEEYDEYIKKLESFQWSTVPKTINDVLGTKCSCQTTKLRR